MSGFEENLKDALSNPGRKRKAVSEELEIDIDAPEPPSKKAARKAKRVKVPTKPNTSELNISLSKSGPAKKQDGRSQFSVWIGNLPFDLQKKDLKSFFTTDPEYPINETEITRVHLPTSSLRSGSGQQNKGFAYVDFSTLQSQKRALQLSEKLLGGRRVLIKSSTDFEGRPENLQNQVANGMTPSKRVFVGNLGFDITKEGLENHFQSCGPVVAVQMATFEDSGKCKGYAWIDFEQASSAAAAVRGWLETVIEKASDTTKTSTRRTWVNKIDGRKLRTEFAEDKATRYNKRFRKNESDSGKYLQEQDDVIKEAMGPIAEQPNISISERRSRKPDRTKAKTTVPEKTKSKPSRYTDETVTKLTGAIVSGEGTKTKFD